MIALFIGAFFYNRFHVSLEEQAITDYMNAQQTQDASDRVEAEPDSAAFDIEDYGHDENIADHQ